MDTVVGMIMGALIAFPIGFYMRGVMRRYHHRMYKRL